MELQEILDVVQKIESQYPEEIFPNDGTSQGNGALMARLTCQNIRREILEQAAQQITAPDRLPHSCPEKRNESAAGGG